MPAPGCAKPALRLRICKPVRQKLLPSVGPCGPRKVDQLQQALLHLETHTHHAVLHAWHSCKMRPRVQRMETCA